ncbi:MAG TPA: RNA methyltransferase [Anaerolineae bacterium]|jgi:TrmH family RNA methyltransferase
MISSTKNPRIVEARKLAQRKHRLRQNCFLVEGLQLLGMALQARTVPALRARIIPRQVFYSEALFAGAMAPQLLAQLVEAGAEASAVAPQVLNALSERDHSQGLTATFALRELEWSLHELDLAGPANIETAETESTTSELTAPGSLILVLDQLQDPGNLGTLIRTADAVGARAVILLEPCVDPFDPKTVRGTMGSLFNVPFARTKNVEEALSYLTGANYRLIGADASRGHLAWQSEALVGPVALVLGNEAHGLTPALRQCLHDFVSLPLRGQAESLNVSVAGGVLMYEWLRMNALSASQQESEHSNENYN